ncbi:MAG: SDR family oxidoreductase [Chloroflexi bacterium]|nr:SDR family oxidoreductase [Chloroflexota bacterium]
MSGRFAGQRILVCGAATGIGAAAARRLAREGANVSLQYRTRASEVETLRDELRNEGAAVEILAADLTLPADVDALFSGADGFGGIVHSVSAPLPSARFDRLPWDEYQAHFDVAVRSAYLILRAALARPAPALRASVFVLTSATLTAPPADWAPYLVAKHALWALVRSAAVELAAKGIRVNCVSPAFTTTPLTAGIDPRVSELIAKSIPMRRLGTPEDAASAIAYLLSDDAAFVTGANLPVGGGLGI